MFHSDFNCKGRDITVLHHRNVQFVKSHVISDRNGCYIIIYIAISFQGKLYGIPVVLVNIYAPNLDLSISDLSMETNRDPQISKGCLWETLKAYLRGIILSYTASANKENAKRLSETEMRICAID